MKVSEELFMCDTERERVLIIRGLLGSAANFVTQQARSNSGYANGAEKLVTQKNKFMEAISGR